MLLWSVLGVLGSWAHNKIYLGSAHSESDSCGLLETWINSIMFLKLMSIPSPGRLDPTCWILMFLRNVLCLSLVPLQFDPQIQHVDIHTNWNTPWSTQRLLRALPPPNRNTINQSAAHTSWTVPQCNYRAAQCTAIPHQNISANGAGTGIHSRLSFYEVVQTQM